jgi:toxin secretion/phage lysis holin
MNTIISWFKVGCSFLGGILGYFLGGFDVMLSTLLVFMLIDYLSGVINAIIKKKLNSSIGAKGILKKVLILLLVGMSNMLGIAIGIETIRYVVISFYLANEGISIIENASKIGVPIPNKIKEVLEQLHKEGE